MDIRQSSYFAHYMQALGWKVVRIGKHNLYLRSIPLLGTYAKLHRPDGKISLSQLATFKKDHHLKELAVEPGITTVIDPKESLKINSVPYLPTRTIVIDLGESEEVLLKNLTEAKRRGIKKAEKRGVQITKGTIENFAVLKQKDYLFPLGYFMKKDLLKLSASFPDKNRCVLSAFEPNVILANEVRPEPVQNSIQESNRLDSGQARITRPIAAVLLFFFDKRAYYWQAVTTQKGKELHAPTLLVWYAICEAKKRGCTEFDFDGVYDSRFAKATSRWKGFTKFKQGFGGKEIEFPNPFIV